MHHKVEMNLINAVHWEHSISCIYIFLMTNYLQ
jgi:hypothetical protein